MTPELPAVPPVAPPPAYKDRRGWLIAFGIVEILIGCLGLLMVAFLLVGFLVLKIPYPNQPGALPMVGLLAMLTIVYGGLAAFFIVVGIGSIRCRNWARVIMIAVSILWLCLGIISTAVLAILLPYVPKPAGASGDPTFHTVMAITVVVMAFVSVVPPVVFLVFYTRKNVKATCLARSRSAAPASGQGVAVAVPAPKLPVPVIILVAWEGLGTFAIFSVMIMPATAVFGVALRGLPAILVMLTYSVVAGLAAWLLYHRDFIGWLLATFKASFGLASGIVTFAGRDMMQIFREMGMSEEQLELYHQFPHLMPIVIYWSILLTGGVLVFLIYARKYFPRTKGEART